MSEEVQEQLASDHECLNERVDRLALDPAADPVELSKLKKLRLRVKDMREGIIPTPIFAT